MPGTREGERRSAQLRNYSQLGTLEIYEPHNRAQRLLSNIYPIKMRDSIEFVYAIHIVDLRPYKASSRNGETEYNF